MLNVKSSTKIDKKNYQKRLALAAFYSTDRTVLRSLIENGKVPSDLDLKEALVHQVKTKSAERKTIDKSSVDHDIDIDSLRQEILINLEQLQKSKSTFFGLIGDEIVIEPVKEEVKKEKVKAKPKAAEKRKKVAEKKASVQKKSVIASRRAVKNKLIDKFIETKPSITPSQDTREAQSDLSRASSELREDLVSENLAMIFAKQGKNEKAIEIYKRLIWKFPQKKASFAARIEELKK
jgi:tetratricopeptide (TPR) repeat protein